MLKDGVFEKEFELSINDVDKYNKMKLTAYLKLMQETGALHSKENGYGIDNENTTHKAWLVICWKIDIFSKPNWNENIKVKTWLYDMDKIYYYRDFEMLDSRGNVIAKAESKWVMVDTLTKKVQKIDEKYRNKFVTVNVPGYDNNIAKLSSRFDINNMKQIYRCKVQKRDIDKNDHMNNVIYLDLALEGIDDKYINNISHIELYYKTECKYKDDIVFMEENRNDGKEIYILDNEREILHTYILLK